MLPVHDAIVERVVSYPDSLNPDRVIHSIYLVGQARWQPPRVQSIVGNLPDEVRVLRVARTDCRGVLRILFDPDKVTVSGHASITAETQLVGVGNADIDTRGVKSSRTSRQARGVETPHSSTERLNGDREGEFKGNTILDTHRTNQRPRVSHAYCDHPKTKEARLVCRRTFGR